MDLLVIVGMVLAASTLLSLCLMFLIKNKTAQRIIFYIVLVLALYMSWVGFYIGISGWFTAQISAAIFTAIMCVVTFIIERFSKGSDKKFLLARILAAATLVIAFTNALLI